MMDIRDTIGTLSPLQKLVAASIVVVAIVAIAASWANTFTAWNANRVLENQATAAKRDAAGALKRAETIALEKLEVEKTLAETEAKLNAKRTEADDAHIKTLDARADYYRTLRESRGDDPSTEQLCRELAALGYPCQ